MQFGNFRPALCMGLLALFCQASLADDKSSSATPDSTVKRSCADPNPATKRECEKVAAKIEAQKNDPAAKAAADEAHADADYVHHSSPAVRSPAEVKQDKAQAKSDRKDQRTKPEPK